MRAQNIAKYMKLNIDIDIYCCSLCGLSNSLSFKNIDQDDIAYIENYAQNNLPDLLKDHKENDEHKNQIFFGAHASSPAKFSLNRGETKLLHELISHVKTNERVGVEINTVLGGKLSSYKNVVQTACGYFFGDKTRFACSALRRENHIEFINHSKAQLITKVKETLDTYGNVLKQKINFTDASRKEKIH